jgi:3-methyl-2-oxobutanoate hydroxymethyltransferase
MPKISLKKINSLKKNKIGISALTSYDASFAKLADNCGIDIILVGDSLGEVIQGKSNTHSVTMNDMCYHTKIVSGAIKKAFLVADMPKNSYKTKNQALKNARRLVAKNMADMVKIEFKEKDAKIIEHLISHNILVCSHIGILPQTIKNKSGYKKVGKTTHEAHRLINEAMLIEKLGSQILLIECVDDKVAKIISRNSHIPVIGIGSGKSCDGQIRVIYDLFEISFNGIPGFLKSKNKKLNPMKKILEKYIINTNKYKL